MIEVRLDPDNLAMTCKGHAGMKGEGEFDLVCAAVSTLLYTLVWSVRQDVRLKLVEGIDYRMDEGDAEIRITPRPEYVARAMNKYQMCCDGLQMLEESYPQAIHIL